MKIDQILPKSCNNIVLQQIYPHVGIRIKLYRQF